MDDISIQAQAAKPARNGAGIESYKLTRSPGRPRGSHTPAAKHASAIARRFRQAGLDWATDFAQAIKSNDKERIALWLKLLPYMVTTASKLRVKKWKGRASKAAIVALEALEGD